MTKDRRIQRFSEEFKEFYHEVIDNVQAEAIEVGKSIESIYAYRDVTRTANHLKAYEIPFSTKAPEILRFLANKIDYDIRPKENHLSLNGQVDDDWAELAEKFAQIRHIFNQGGKFQPVLVTEFLHAVYQLIEEWRARG